MRRALTCLVLAVIGDSTSLHINVEPTGGSTGVGLPASAGARLTFHSLTEAAAAVASATEPVTVNLLPGIHHVGYRFAPPHARSVRATGP